MARAVQTSYVDGESTHSDGGDPTPKKGIENHERTTSASRLERSRPARLRERYKRPMWTARAYSDGGGPTPKRASRTMNAQRARLDLNDCPARWRERYKRPMRTARAHSDGGGPTPKKDIENHERTMSASHLERSPCTMAGRRELSDGGGPTPKKGIENHERTTSASRLERSPCTMA